MGPDGAGPSRRVRGSYDHEAAVSRLASLKEIPMNRRKSPVHMPTVRLAEGPIIVFLTVCAKDRKMILATREAHQTLCEAWEATRGWLVGKYLIMPDHIHLFCAPAGPDHPELSVWVKCWKTYASIRWPRRSEQPIWQKSFWDTQLRRSERYEDKWDYVVQNPVRKRLCGNPNEWPFQGEINVLPW